MPNRAKMSIPSVQILKLLEECPSDVSSDNDECTNDISKQETASKPKSMLEENIEKLSSHMKDEIVLDLYLSEDEEPQCLDTVEVDHGPFGNDNEYRNDKQDLHMEDQTVSHLSEEVQQKFVRDALEVDYESHVHESMAEYRNDLQSISMRDIHFSEQVSETEIIHSKNVDFIDSLITAEVSDMCSEEIDMNIPVDGLELDYEGCRSQNVGNIFMHPPRDEFYNNLSNSYSHDLTSCTEFNSKLAVNPKCVGVDVVNQSKAQKRGISLNIQDLVLKNKVRYEGDILAKQMEEVNHGTYQDVHDMIMESEKRNKVDENTDIRETDVNEEVYSGIIDACFCKKSLDKFNDEDTGK